MEIASSVAVYQWHEATLKSRDGVLQLDRTAHEIFAVSGQLVVLYQDGSLGTTDRLLYEADCAASMPYIMWSRLHHADKSACIVVVFRDKVRYVIPLVIVISTVPCSHTI